MRRIQLALVFFVAQSFLIGAGCTRKSVKSRPIENGKSRVESCSSSLSSKCEAIRLQIDDLVSERDQSIANQDISRVVTLTLELNHQEEYLKILSSGQGSTDESLTKLDSKYSQLRNILDRKLRQEANTLASRGDGSSWMPTTLYDPREANVVAQVMADLGDLYVKESGIHHDGSPKWEELKLNQPWAGYWFPLQGQSLFGDENSPLAKLDKLSAIRNQHTSSASLESMQTSLAQEGWEGRCAAWAMASILSKEPLAAREIDGISFSIRDQKALLTKIFELYPSRTYGIRYDGNDSTDGTLQDIRPEALHKIFLHQLGEQKRHFIVDESSGIEIWSKPVYRIRWTVQPDPEEHHAFRVIAQPWLLKHRNDENEAPTSDADRSSPEWTYRLYFDPSDQKDGRFRVIAGEWLGHSRDHHPDTITIPIQGKDAKSSNVEINKVMNLVKEIVDLEP